MSKFLCPYHFEEVDTRDICFRCINPDPSKCEREVDKELSEYWRMHVERKMPRVIKPEVPFYKSRVSRAKCPECGMVSPKMICPVCHNELPHTVGEVKDYMFALIGAKQAGKSVYIATLINALAQQIGQRLNASLMALNEETIARYRDEFYRPIFQNKEVVKATLSAATSDGLKHPLLYRFGIEEKGIFGNRNNKVATFAFFDTAGEDLNSIEIMRREIKYTSNAQGIIFLLDPLQISAVRDQLPHDTVLPHVHTEPAEIVTRVINLIREDRQMPEKDLIDIPVALAFSKIDAILPIIRPDSRLNSASVHSDSFDIKDFELIHSEMRSHLESWIGPEFDTIVRHNFQTYGYFGLSALGAAPTGDGRLTEVVSPRRIEDPFLWLLWKKKLIKGRREKSKLGV